MKMNNKNHMAKNHEENILSNLLEEITPEEQEWSDFKMLQSARIYDAMKAKGWNQAQFAETMQVSPSLICKWLSGTQNLNSQTLWLIQKKLDITLLQVKDEPKVVKRIYRASYVQSHHPVNAGSVDFIKGLKGASIKKGREHILTHSSAFGVLNTSDIREGQIGEFIYGS